MVKTEAQSEDEEKGRQDGQEQLCKKAQAWDRTPCHRKPGMIWSGGHSAAQITKDPYASTHTTAPM